MEWQQRLYSKEAEKLVEGILTGEEFESLDVQMAAIRKAGGPLGLQEIRIKGKARFIIVYAYASKIFEAIFILSYHLERRGEPTPTQVKMVEKYAQEIRAKELRVE